MRRWIATRSCQKTAQFHPEKQDGLVIHGSLHDGICCYSLEDDAKKQSMRERVKQCAAPCNRGDRLFIFKSGKSLYHSARKQRRKQPVSKEGATALQKEGATNALSPQSNPLPLYTKKKRDLSAAKLPPVPGH
jgi:hypothetical protein